MLAEHCEVVLGTDAADGLLQLISKQVEVIIIDAQMRQDEIIKFLKILSRKADWLKCGLVILNYEGKVKEIDDILGSFEKVLFIDTLLTVPQKFIEQVKGLVPRHELGK